jgi:5-formyltetrahydrofolate cyclo-ligase
MEKAPCYRFNGRVVVPVIQKSLRKILPYRVINPEVDLVDGVWGIKQPNPKRCQLFSPGDIELVIVPGVAFDERGYRIVVAVKRENQPALSKAKGDA